MSAIQNLADASPLTIQDVSRLSGLSEPTLRYYEKIGLIDPVDRNESSGHRRGADHRGVELPAVDRNERPGHARLPPAPVRGVGRGPCRSSCPCTSAWSTYATSPTSIYAP
ncbi:MerR family DNA-binding transcriptional regulator [Nonomuraea sp. NPDC050643]|uniref:MerR family DNA-binding transcriptional regulator n=1 Tax=Nonomuraea sp. NPDC050643 TaxID=3155660 RepID=UPI00340F6525